MENFKTNALSCNIRSLLDNDVEFSQKLKEHLLLKSNEVSNPLKFIGALLSKGILCDGSVDSEANVKLKEMMARLAIMIACSKGSQGIGGLMAAFEESGNSQLISDCQDWFKHNFGDETERNFGETLGDDATVQAINKEVLANQKNSANKISSYGTKLIDKMMSRVENDLMEQLEGHFVGKAHEIVNATQLCSSLVNQKVLSENDIQLATEPKVYGLEAQNIEKVIKAACSKKAIGSLVLALQSSNSKCILAETCAWLETLPARKINCPMANRQMPTATGLFAATDLGLISLDLRTLEATALTNRYTGAVAVNHKLKKVYWTENPGYCGVLMSSNFDGSGREVILPKIGGWMHMLSVDEASGNIYFTLDGSHEISVCNALGQNCTTVISNPSLVSLPVSLAVDSKNGFVYWSNIGFSLNSLVRANMDGSNATIISNRFHSLRGITLDQTSNGVLYWADWGESAIGTIDFSGGNKRKLVKLEGYSSPWGIQGDAHKIYFSNWWSKNIQSVDRVSGEELTTIFNSPGIVRDIARFYDSVRYPCP